MFPNFRFVYLTLTLAFTQHSYAQVNSININTPANEYAPAISADGKTMIFQSNREGGYKLFESNLSEAGNWSEPKAINEINNTEKRYVLIGGPSLTFDGNQLYFCALREGGLGDMDIYFSTRNNGSWSIPANIGAPVNTEAYEGFPSISGDGKKLYFTRNAKEQGCFKVLTTEVTEAGTWKQPEELPASINSGCLRAPKILSDGRTLVFASKSNSGKGEFDLYKTVLSKDGIWGDPVALDFTNTNKSESAAAINELSEKIFFTSEGDIYSTNVPANYILNKVSLNVVDAENKKPIKASVTLRDAKNKSTLKSDSSNANGNYQVVLLPGKVYDLDVFFPGYDMQSVNANFLTNQDFKRIDKTIELKPKKREVILKISDKETNKGLSVDIKITNLETGEEMVIHETLGRDGQYAVNLREGNKYNVEVSSSNGYAYSTMKLDVPASIQTYDPTNVIADTSSGTYVPKAIPEPLPLTQEIEVTPLKQGTKLVLKDIFFEFNAHELKDSSYVELNRVVDLLKENPTITIEINAHTDDVGSDDFNLKLSQKRAQIIVDYLVSKGVDAHRLKPIGYGKSKPVASNATEEGRAKNRRVEMKILEIKK